MGGRGLRIQPDQRRVRHTAFAAAIDQLSVGATTVLMRERPRLKPLACIVLKDPSQANEALASQLQQHVKQMLQPHKYPRRVEFLTELPKTATGKIQRFKLRQKYAGQAPAQI